MYIKWMWLCLCSPPVRRQRGRRERLSRHHLPHGSPGGGQDENYRHPPHPHSLHPYGQPPSHPPPGLDEPRAFHPPTLSPRLLHPPQQGAMVMDLHEQVRGLGQGLCGMITGTKGTLMRFPTKKVKQTLKMSCIITFFVCVMYPNSPINRAQGPLHQPKQKGLYFKSYYTGYYVAFTDAYFHHGKKGIAFFPPSQLWGFFSLVIVYILQFRLFFSSPNCKFTSHNFDYISQFWQKISQNYKM